MFVTICMVVAREFAGVPAPRVEFLVVRDCDRRVGFLREGAMHIGTFDADGGFHEVETLNIRNQSSIKLKQVGEEWIDNRLSGPYTNVSWRGPAFEYKAGRLVSGEVNSQGVFVPGNATANRIGDFRDYLPGPNAPPIWNLPGYFMRRDTYEKRRKWLADHLSEEPNYGKEKAKLDAAIEWKK